MADRRLWLSRLSTIITRHSDKLTDLLHEELGKPRFEALASDIMPLLAAIRWHAQRAARVLGPQRLRGKPWWMIGTTHHVVRVPVGHVGIIATWNYPVQLLGVQALQALVAGNRVSVKPSEHAPRTQTLLMDLFSGAGIPPDRLRVLAATREAGRRMLEEQAFDHVVFTGSTSVGREIASILAQRFTPSTLELSGRDSAIVLGDTDPTLAARCIWSGVVMNAGQTCMAPRRALVHESVYSRFLAALAPLAAGARPRRLITSAAAARVFELASLAARQGARSLSGVLEPPSASDPRWLRPLAMVDCPAGASLVDGDHFGPVIAVVPVSSLEEALEVHRGSSGADAREQHLSTSLFTGSREAIDRVTSSVANTVTVNDVIVPTVHPRASVTGAGPSGWGPGRGEAGLLSMTRAVHVSRTSTMVRIPPETPAPAIARRLERVIRWWYR